MAHYERRIKHELNCCYQQQRTESGRCQPGDDGLDASIEVAQHAAGVQVCVDPIGRLAGWPAAHGRAAGRIHYRVIEAVCGDMEGFWRSIWNKYGASRRDELTEDMYQDMIDRLRAIQCVNRPKSRQLLLQFLEQKYSINRDQTTD